eukprot:jgi/Botrbrau1/15235/Bobra.0149s0088.1
MDMAHFPSSFSLWLLTFIVIACLGVVVLLVGRPPNPPPSLGSFKQLKIFKTAQDQDAFALLEPKRGRGRPAKAVLTDLEERIPRRRATDPESGISGARCPEEELFDSGTEDTNFEGRKRKRSKKSLSTKDIDLRRGFMPTWLAIFPWLRWDATQNVAHCAPCQAANQGVPLARGVSKHKKDALMKHQQSEGHEAAMKSYARNLHIVSRIGNNYAVAARKLGVGREVLFYHELCQEL